MKDHWPILQTLSTPWFSSHLMLAISVPSFLRPVDMLSSTLLLLSTIRMHQAPVPRIEVSRYMIGEFDHIFCRRIGILWHDIFNKSAFSKVTHNAIDCKCLVRLCVSDCSQLYVVCVDEFIMSELGSFRGLWSWLYALFANDSSVAWSMDTVFYIPFSSIVILLGYTLPTPDGSFLAGISFLYNSVASCTAAEVVSYSR